MKNNSKLKIFLLVSFLLFNTCFSSYSHEIKITDGNLCIDNKPTFLYAGDLHYFRTREKNFSSAKTYEMWEETLDKMKEAGMNLVTTYIPWDYHEISENHFDFTKAKNIQLFLDMAYKRNMYVIVKLGPFITAEWPHGFGSFGGVPEWWKTKYPNSLAKKSNQANFRFFPTASNQVQPSLLDKQFLLSTEKWYEKVMEEIKPFMGKCIIGIQIDNETNLFWGERYGDVDYSQSSIRFYHKWLRSNYQSIEKLNKAYNTSFKSFSDVSPPSKAPTKNEFFNHSYFKDWYEVGQEYIKTYLLTLKNLLEKKLVNKNEVFFLVNDSPFGLSVGDYARNVMLHDTTKKRAIANIGIDLYPKQLVFNQELADQPFQADYFTKLIKKLSGNNFVFGTELQGGFYEIPFLGRAKVSKEATEQLLARSIGHGLKGAAFYVIRDGLNLDNSSYNYDSAITYEGKSTERFEIMKNWGSFLSKYSNELLKSEEISNNVAILQNKIYQVPSKYNNQNFYTIDYPALYGLLLNANINPELLEASETSEKDLKKYKVLLYQNAGYVDQKTASLLKKYVFNGGTLVNFLAEGKIDESFLKENDFNKLFNIKNKANISNYDSNKQIKTINYGKGKLIHIENNIYHIFNTSDYYKAENDDFKENLSIIKKLFNENDEKPIISSTKNKFITWSRKTKDTIFIFVVNDNKSINKTTIKLDSPELLGLDKNNNYNIEFGFHNQKSRVFLGSDLISKGVDISLKPLSTQVIILENTPKKTLIKE